MSRIVRALTMTVFLGALPKAAIAQPRERATFQGHRGAVLSLSFSPDGKTLASGGGGIVLKTRKPWGEIKLWDVQTGKVRATLQGHTKWVFSVAFSPDGKTLASGGGDRTIRLWDVQTGKEQVSFEGKLPRGDPVAFSPDGKTLASGDIGSSGVGEINLWDVQTGKVRATLKLRSTLEAPLNHVTSLAFSPDGKTLASGGGDRTIKLWDVRAGKERASLRGGYTVKSLSFSPDGKTLASGGHDGTIKLWDAQTGKERAALRGHKPGLLYVTFGPDSKALVSGRVRTIKLWDVRTGKEQATIHVGAEFVMNSLALSPDGKTLASGSYDGTIKLWDLGPAK